MVHSSKEKHKSGGGGHHLEGKVSTSTKTKKTSAHPAPSKKRSWFPRWMGYSALTDKKNKTGSLAPLVLCVAVLAIIAIVLGVVGGLGKFSSASSSTNSASNPSPPPSSSSSSTGSSSSVPNSNLFYFYPLRTNYLDSTGSTTAAAVDTSVTGCVPSFPTTEFPNSQYGNAWLNPCETTDQGVAITMPNMPASFTLSGVYMPSTGHPNVFMVWGSGQVSGVTWYLQYAFSTGQFSGVFAGGDYWVGYTNYVIQTGVWYHIAATYDAILGVGKLYIDGAQVGATTNVDPATQTVWGTDSSTARSSVVIGGFRQGDFDFTGSFYNQRCYSTVLSSSDIYTLYTADFNSPGGTVPLSSLSSTGIAAPPNPVFSQAGWYDNSSILLFSYPLRSNTSDVTGQTTAVVGVTGLSGPCTPTTASVTLASGSTGSAFYNPCDTVGQGLVLSGGATTSNSFTYSGMFNFKPVKTTNIFMFFGSDRTGLTGTSTWPLGYILQFDLTTNVWEGSITYVDYFIGDVAGQVLFNTWTHVVHTFDATSGDNALYVNGQLFTSYKTSGLGVARWTNSSAAHAPLMLGGYKGDGCTSADCAFTGYMYAVRGFNLVVPATQVAQLYNHDTVS